ncbi:MAG: hypothetical protein DI547_12665 [Sphingobium sp.]|nr:MAG: hypothetical protein DI547_12665 [Sphingobium sp.]
MILSLALLLASASQAAGPESPPPPPPGGGPFSAADADHDGCISRAELQAWLDSEFAAKDQNGDGMIPVRQLLQAAPQGGQADRPKGPPQGEGEPPRMGGGGPGNGPPPARRGSGSGFGGNSGDRPPAMQPVDGPAGMPRFEDGNDDGMIDAAEFAAPALAMFDTMDANHDGMLSADELPPPPPRNDSGE